MARLQVPKNIDVGSFSTTAVQLSSSDLHVTSFVVQAPASNTDFIKVGTRTGQYYQIAPGKDLAINGDNLDNGTTAYLSLNEWYVSSVSGTQTCNVLYLERF